MTTYNIYHKPCPACGAMVSTGTKSCDCGHSFESIDETSMLPEEQALQEEELFDAYLAARVDQTVAAVESARAEFAVDQLNPRKSAELLQAVQGALALRDAREAQADKIVHAREIAQAARKKLAPATPDLPDQSFQPTEAFRNKQAAKAEKVIEAFANTETKKCLHCKTVLPVTSALCCCGYIFASHNFMLPRSVDVSTRGDMYRPK